MGTPEKSATPRWKAVVWFAWSKFLGPCRRALRLVNWRAAVRLGILRQYGPRVPVLPEYPRTQLGEWPRISLVTPSFNQGRFLRRTVLSILDQGYPCLEYFVADGGSGDGTREILNEFSGRLSGWVSEQDEGQSHALNKGFSRMTGEIMGYLNADDMLLPGSLHLVAAYFSRNPDVDAVYSHRLIIDEQDREVGRWILPQHSDTMLRYADFVPQETLFWRRRIWEKAGGRIDESFDFAMDWDLLVRFLDAGAVIRRLPVFLGAFRVHDNQKTAVLINDVGNREMQKIRQHCLGFQPSTVQISRALFGYFLRHILLTNLDSAGRGIEMLFPVLRRRS